MANFQMQFHLHTNCERIENELLFEIVWIIYLWRIVLFVARISDISYFMAFMDCALLHFKKGQRDANRI